MKTIDAETSNRLRGWFPPGSTVYTVLRHVSRSGMQRTIGVVGLIPTTERKHFPVADIHPNYAVAEVTGRRVDSRRDGIICNGAGMDMGYDLVYSLSRALYPNGFGCIGDGCPSNDHSNGDHDYTPHTIDLATNKVRAAGFPVDPSTNKYHWHNDGGYALRQRWL